MDYEEVTNISNISNSTPQYDNSTGKTGTQPELLEPLLMFYGVVAGLFALLALFGNVPTIAAVVKFEYLQTRTNLLICCLAMCDVAIVLVIFPLNAWLSFHRHTKEKLPDSWLMCCKISEFLKHFFILGSIYSILLIGLDRWLYLDYPLQYPISISYHKKKLLVFAPLLFLLLVIPTGVCTAAATVDVPSPVCALVYVYAQSPSRLLTLAIFTCMLLATCIIYIRITYIAITYNMKRQVWFSTRNVPVPSSHIYIKVLRMIALIFWINVIVYVPFMVVSALSLQISVWYMEYLEYAFRLIQRISTWINPIVYAWSSEHFRKAFMTILRIRNHNTTPSISQINFNWT